MANNYNKPTDTSKSLFKNIEIDSISTSNSISPESINLNVFDTIYSLIDQSMKDIISIDNKIIFNLFHNVSYLNEYIRFLLGTYTDDEFDIISQKYVRDYGNATLSEIILTLKRLKGIINDRFNIDELTEILNIPHEIINEAINKISI